MAVVKPEIKTTEYEMFSRYRETGDIALRDEIVSSYIYIAEILSRKFINRGVEYDDIFQVACMGILYAVERFDPDKGVKFATYATPTVMGEIRKYFRDKGNFIRIPRRLYEIFYKAEKIKRVSSEISQEEIARILNIPEKLLENVYEVGDTSFIKSLEYEAYADGELNFSDVADDSWYAKAVLWAYNNDIVSGKTETEFDPNSDITREQMAVILYRYAKTKGYNSDSDEITYSDVKDIAEYAIDSVKWAYCAGIMTGDENGNFNPKAGTTRAQAASVFMRLYK